MEPIVLGYIASIVLGYIASIVLGAVEANRIMIKL